MEKAKLSKWMDWYWNKGGREKVQARRYINEYKRYQKKIEEKPYASSRIA